MKQGWEKVSLTDISVNLDSKRIPITKGVRTGGVYPYYGASGIVDYVSDYIFDDDLLLISEDGANLLARSTPIAFSVSGKIWVNNHAHILKFENKITQRYIERYFESIKIDGFVTGAAQPKLNQKALNSIPIIIPKDILEQERIVGILDSVFAKIEALRANAQQNLQNTKDLFQASLKQELTPKHGWTSESVKDLSKDIFAGGDAPQDNFSEYRTDKYNIPIYANAVKDDGLYGYTDFARVTEPSLTIAARGSGTGYVLERKEAYLPIVRLIVIIPKQKQIQLRYLYYSFKGLDIMRSGSAIPQLTVPMIKNYTISFPSISEQQSIVEKLDALSERCRAMEENYRQTIAHCNALKQTLLTKAFNGEL